MKQVTIVIPGGDVNLSSVTGTYEILTRADAYWQKMGHRQMMNVRIAGFVSGLKPDTGFFSLHPLNLRDIKKTDLLIIPSFSHDYDKIIRENAVLINWIREQ